jgi:hypothetical protein
MNAEPLSAHQKALAINLDRLRYGTLAEIGAGQETARWFFRVGGAAGTIAKTMSAYDMTFSDSIYGPSPRYVSRERLHAMLELEYRLLIERLGAARGAETAFFAFADTVAARSFSRTEDGHGWLGMRFQTAPGAPPSQIEIHVNLYGRKPTQDQETLGLLGVNLCYGALYLHADPEALLVSLLDGLSRDLVEVDMIELGGPAFAAMDNRLMALRLVQRGLTDAALFTADGHVVQVADALYRKAVLLERSRFRPPTRFNVALLDAAQALFLQESGIAPAELVVLSEMTLSSLTEGGEVDARDFLDRAEILCALGKNVLISNYGAYYRLAQFLFRHTKRPVAIAMGLPSLQAVFDEKYYADLAGGILESFGRMFKHDLRLYVCPQRDSASGALTGVGELQVAPHLRHLYAHLLENGRIRALDTIEPQCLAIFSDQVLDRIRRGERGWETLVPEPVARMIKQRRLFGYRA